ncbi:MAG: heme exporter protein CcmB [Planctomycetia bacterium]|nr:heme exporter protein CcmB [Planctomycetia bacterium]
MFADCCRIIHKDLVSEFRSRRAWPAMLLVGVVAALVFSLQMDLLPHEKPRLVGGLLWVSVFLAGAAVIERSVAGERDDGCWDGLRMMPIAPGALYVAKLAVNFLALLALGCLLLPLYFLLSDLPLLSHVRALASVALPACLGLAAVGTLAAALSAGNGRSGSLLLLVAMPLVFPVILAAAECTRLAAEDRFDDAWWRWMQLLWAFAIVFVTAGTLLFDYAIEE